MLYPLDLKPAFKDYIWGGTRLPDEFGFDTPLRPVAEAWVLSVHPDGKSTVANGALADKTLDEALPAFGEAALGTAAAKFARFPVLIKLIDAREALSVQVHPSDEYALRTEGEYGKTEMWYVAGSAPGAYLYYGFSREIGREEFKARIENNTLLEVLNKVPVKKGDCFFIEAGTLHAIGAGLLIAEVQQNSNSTYRVYDYGRLGADGRPRPLHIDKALDVTKLTPPNAPDFSGIPGRYGPPLAACAYFSCAYIDTAQTKRLAADESSFLCLLVLEGAGEMRCAGERLALKKGSCVFIPAGLGNIDFSGGARMLATYLEP